MKRVLLCVVAVLLVIGIVNLSYADAYVTQAQQVIKTYPYGGPDSVPILTRATRWGKSTALYPYYFFHNFSHQPIDKSYKVVTLENDHVILWILPEVGGKIWGAVEKKSGHEFIYKNKVVKFREVALRGPWTSGGIEWNFGIIGHTPAAANNVDYLTRKNPDGSVSCFVGSMDLPSRTRWTVEIRLPADKAFFETRAVWQNPTDMFQSYYVWMNAATSVSDDLEFIMPGNKHVAHNYAVPTKTWPVDKNGHHNNWYKDNKHGASKSYFVFGEYEEWWGGYWHDKNFGFGHWSRFDDIPGKKVWLWALSRQGAIWEDLLTDTDGQYCEPQSGRFYNQNDHGLFAPCTSDQFREIWFGYRDTGGMVKANKSAVLNVQKADGLLSLSLYALADLDEEIVVKSGQRKVWSTNVKLKAAQTWNEDIEFLSRGKLSVHVGNKISYVDDPPANDLARTFNFHHYDVSTTEGMFRAAERFKARRYYDNSLKAYLKVLDKEPAHLGALNGTAEMYCLRAEYAKALKYAFAAIDHCMYDAKANYIYAVISRRLGKTVDAKEAFGWASRSLEFRSAAYLQMSQIYTAEADYDSAAEYIDKALTFNGHNTGACHLKATLLRIQNEKDSADYIADMIQKYPLDHLWRWQKYLLTNNTDDRDAFIANTQGEMNYQEYIEAAMYYYNLGFDKQAVQILENAPAQPTVSYWLAYLLRETDTEESDKYLNLAKKMSPDLVFPSRHETIDVCKWAVSKDSADWKAKYYLSLLYWMRMREPEAAQLLKDCGSPDFAPFYQTRALMFKDSEPIFSLADFRKSIEIDNTSKQGWHRLIKACLDLQMNPEALEAAKNAINAVGSDATVTQIDLLRAYMANKKWADAIEGFKKVNALPYEGAQDVRNLFVRCHVESAIENINAEKYDNAITHLEASKAYPESLGTGKPFIPDYRLQDYIEMICYDKAGDKINRDAALARMLDFTRNEEITAELENGIGFIYFGGIALRKAGQTAEADNYMNLWQQTLNAQPLVNWYAAVYNKDKKTAQNLADQLKNDDYWKMINTAVNFVKTVENCD
jgi:tetratricopeptide (TPR) repeat protein